MVYIKKKDPRNLFHGSSVSLVVFSLSTDSSPEDIDTNACFSISYTPNFLSLLFHYASIVGNFFFSNSSNKCVCLFVFPCALVTNPTWKVHKEKQW